MKNGHDSVERFAETDIVRSMRDTEFYQHTLGNAVAWKVTGARLEKEQQRVTVSVGQKTDTSLF